jgi:S-formylglutathione hydrolase
MGLDVKQVGKSRAFGCDILRFSHISPTLCGLETKWAAIVPDFDGTPLPCLYWYSGLTCTDENFMQKAGAARAASEHRVIVIAPDTSPRGAHAPGEDDSWDFGTGAGFYVDATAADYARHYRMYSFCQEELPSAVEAALGEQVDMSRSSVFGHSMGGMGALVAALRNPAKYKSVSAFAPISHPSKCSWGEKCFSKYLGGGDEESRSAWKSYDPTELVLAGHKASSPLLIDQGADDAFLKQGQLHPNDLEEACVKTGQKIELRMQPGYGHDYYFIQTFIAEHMAWHAKFLQE